MLNVQSQSKGQESCTPVTKWKPKTFFCGVAGYQNRNKKNIELKPHNTSKDPAHTIVLNQALMSK